MATWEDGPEYAPLERPGSFEDHDQPALEQVVRTPIVVVDAPVERPAFTPNQAQTIPLAEYAPPVEPPRNPKKAFEVVSAALTSSDGVAVEWTPDKPFGTSAPIAGYIPPAQTVSPYAQINAPVYPAPGTPGWFGPATPGVEAVKPAAMIVRIVQGVTPAVLISLALGGFVWQLSLLALLVSFLFSTKIRYQTSSIRQLYGAALVILSLFGITAYLSYPDFVDVFGIVSNVAQPICWIMVAVFIVLTYLAISREDNRKQKTGHGRRN